MAKLRIACIICVVLVSFVPNDAKALYMLPVDRSVVWEGNVGVLGGIPVRSAVCATLNAINGDNAPQVQSAIAACPTGQVVKLNAGLYSVSSPITVKSGITLRGDGMGKTIIKGASGMSGIYVVGMNSGYYAGSAVALDGGYTKGSTTITTLNAHGWTVGDIIVIDQENNSEDDPVVANVGTDGTCNWCGRNGMNRSLGQMAKVGAIPNANTATLEVPLYWDYDAGLHPEATKLNGITKNAGIEQLTVDNVDSGNANQIDYGGTISFRGTSGCWLDGVEGIGSYQNMVELSAVYRNTIRGGKFHDGIDRIATAYGVGRAYGIRFLAFASGNLIENNYIYHLKPALIMNGVASGNVIAYNYIRDMKIDPSNWEAPAIQIHGAHPMMNLIEGNDMEGRMNADITWGSSSHNTIFRNKITLNTAGVTRALWNIDLHLASTYYNTIGNVLGTSGVETTYQFENAAIPLGTIANYRLGYYGDGDSDAAGNDQKVLATLLRHGNWESVRNTISWDSAINDHTLPQSLYLSAKPAWWGGAPWPAIGPDLSPMASIIPAATIGNVSCSGFTYSAWSSCANGLQTRAVLSSFPEGCAGGNPIVSQGCFIPVTYAIDDFLLLVSNWRKTQSGLSSDLNKDSIIDAHDLGIMMTNWGD